MSFPIVNGTLIDTVLETRSKPIAMPSGFFSGRARAAILRNEDALLPDSCVFEGRKRLHIDLVGEFAFGCAELSCVGLLSETGEEAEDEGSGEREGGDDAKHLREGSLRDAIRLLVGVWSLRKHGGLETCRERGPKAVARSVGVTKMRAGNASIVVDVDGSAGWGD